MQEISVDDEAGFMRDGDADELLPCMPAQKLLIFHEGKLLRNVN